MTAIAERPFLDVPSLAARWGEHPNTIRARLKDGRIPPSAWFRPGGVRTDKRGFSMGKILIRVAEVERLEREWA